MFRRRFVFGLTVALGVASLILALQLPSNRDSTDQEHFRIVRVTTTSSPMEAPVVAANVVTASIEEETALIDEVTSQVSTTTTVAEPKKSSGKKKTTTTQASTTTTTSPSTTSPPTTSPTTTSPPSTNEGFVSSAESEFASLINSYRSSKGLDKLSRDGSLNSYARSWAKHMAQTGDLTHSNISTLLPPWSAVGENIGKGGAVDPIFEALVASGSHLENMVGDFTDFGIGVYRDSKGTLWTCHVFAR